MFNLYLHKKKMLMRVRQTVSTYRVNKHMSKPISLYLDDERIPKTDRHWKIVRSYDEAVSYVIAYGLPTHVSFDHDLGLGKSGYDFAKWIVEYDLDHPGTIPDGFSFNVHSANPVGAANISGLITSYLRSKHT